MWRRTEAWRGWLGGICGALLLAGCATTRVSLQPLPLAAQQELLQGLSGFRLDGRTAVQVGKDGFSPRLSWRQQARQSEVKLSSPVGIGGSMGLVYSPDSLRVTTSHGEKLEDGAAQRAIIEQVGFMPPFDALHFWVLGLAAPGDPPRQLDNDADGRIADMWQQGWHIHYDRWMLVGTRDGAVRLPQRITATRDELRLKLFVSRWQLQVQH